MITYPGLPGPEIGEHLSFDASTAQLQPRYRVRDRFDQHSRQHRHLPGHPAHRFPDGHDLAYLPLKRCVLLPAVVVDAERVIGPAESTEVDVDGSAVLLRTGWDQHWGTSRYGDPAHPHLTDAGARVLADRGAVLVGIDSVNIDDTSTGQRPAHTILLGRWYTHRRAPHRPSRSLGHRRTHHRRAASGARTGRLSGPRLRKCAVAETGPPLEPDSPDTSQVAAY